MNVALVAPAATVTLAGTVATAVLLLPSVTTAPPAGAALLNVTVPVEEAPPVTLVGFRLTEVTTTAGAFTVSVKLCEALVPTPLLAVMVREYVPPLPTTASRSALQSHFHWLGTSHRWAACPSPPPKASVSPSWLSRNSLPSQP